MAEALSKLTIALSFVTGAANTLPYQAAVLFWKKQSVAQQWRVSGSGGLGNLLCMLGKVFATPGATVQTEGKNGQGACQEREG